MTLVGAWSEPGLRWRCDGCCVESVALVPGDPPPLGWTRVEQGPRHWCPECRYLLGVGDEVESESDA